MKEEEKDIIELGEEDAAIVLKEDGELQMYIPDKEDVGENVQFITALGCLMHDENFREYVWTWWRDQVDSIKEEGEDELEFDFEPEEL
jgi:hypothetical protein